MSQPRQWRRATPLHRRQRPAHRTRRCPSVSSKKSGGGQTAKSAAPPRERPDDSAAAAVGEDNERIADSQAGNLASLRLSLRRDRRGGASFRAAADLTHRTTTMANHPYRIERDSMGEVRVPADALYGVQTQRAIENFPISGLRFPRAFLRALGMIKGAAAAANQDLGLLEPEMAGAIQQAAKEVENGLHDAH